ncbi:RagB/SusD family nutrient uptake outer membrane protein [Marinifilum sp. D737]|uniref:RagB/SusD family nutrient uptake outer membrane protein n=1 Tax=Marinifilum sp. D737 TaxID=2969628 RepID=UPI00227562EB|nr:RagB/SusD family nutrient uptake outer membrane protein [Marinifilum sp. D737]MCY1633435.1 RagB/SusD family nutrient uptake outer membrane protein [Marinifilum sp. D737]
MKFVKYILIIAVSLMGWSCNDYLDTAPDERQEIKTLQNVEELVANSYSDASYLFLEWMTDNAVALAKNDQEEWMTQNFMWQPVTANEGQDTPTWFWTRSYAAIAHANQALASIDKVPDTNNAYKKAIKGEALLSRAYNHFLLANVFCQAYEESTAASSLGIPYITAPETNLVVSYERGTLKEAYDKVEKDLLEGLSLVSDEFYSGSGKYHFNKGAAYAFASRFYLFKGDYENCIKYSNKLLGEGVVAPVFVRNMEQVFTGTNSTQIADKFTDPNNVANLLNVRKESFALRAYRGYQSSYDVMDEVFVNIWGVTDFRDSRWGWGDARAQPKYKERFKFTTATTGYGYHIQNELRTEEVIFNRMEAYVMTNVAGTSENLDKALADYNVLAAKCYEGSPVLKAEDITKEYGAYDAANMMKFIIAERRKELLRESIRWFDIKRFKMSITHTSVTKESSTLEAEDLRKAVQIPQGAIARGIQANPR